MNTYTIRGNSSVGDISLEGDTVQSAIEGSFGSIVRKICPGIGNAAGYTLNRVWFEKQDNGKTKLHIIAAGSDSVVDYDPTTDIPKEYTIVISGLQSEELLEPEEVSLKESELFDPMNFDPESKTDCLGALKAVVDELTEKHCTFKPEYRPSMAVSLRFPNMEQVNTQTYISQMMLNLTRSRPKKTKAANMLLDRAEELVGCLSDVKSLSLTDLGAVSIRYYQSRQYFDNMDKITALAKYRQKAGLTQQQLADRVGISLRQIAAYENPRTTRLGDARYTVLQKLADALGVKTEDLVDGGIAIRCEINDEQLLGAAAMTFESM